MPVRILQSNSDFQRYAAWLQTHPQNNLWQSLERKAYVEALGKEVRIYLAEEGDEIIASALVVIDRTSFGLSTWEVPRGPLWQDAASLEALMAQLTQDAKAAGALVIYLSPPVEMPSDHSPLSPRHVHCEATRIVDLTKSEDEILAQMKPKGRYNIKVARKHGITVEESDDIEAFYQLVKETSGRDGFTALPKEKYQAFLKHLPGSFCLLASDGSQPIAGLLGVVYSGTGIYYYGASAYAQRAKMAPYLLQWEAMRFCKQQGCSHYDLLGIAPTGASEGHPWQGISAFKEKFGGKITNYPAEKQILLRKVAYHLLQLKRRFLP